MLGVDKGTAEEFYSQCLSNAEILDRSAHARARKGDGIAAVACAWGADVAIVQAVIWERILIASSNPLRQFYQVAGVTVTALSNEDADGPKRRVATAEHMIRAARMRVQSAFDASLAADIAARWSDVTYLAPLPAFTPVQVQAAVEARLLGVSAGEFIEHRRREAAASMLEAQSRRVHGDTAGAIQAGYDSDFLSLDAYLIESAIAVGDDALLTVISRWELATRAVAGLPGLPPDFLAAVGVVREALATSLGEADGARLRRTFAAV